MKTAKNGLRYTLRNSSTVCTDTGLCVLLATEKAIRGSRWLLVLDRGVSFAYLNV